MKPIKRLTFLLLFFSGSLVSFGQADSSGRFNFRYYNQFLAGSFIGNDHLRYVFSGSMFHGIRFGRFGFDAGVSCDRYPEWKIIPVMGGLSFDFANGRNHSWYLLANSGPARVRHVSTRGESFLYDDEKGMRYQAGMGLRVKLARWNLYARGGYHLQRISYTIIPRWVWRDGPSPYRSEIKMDMERIFLQVGFGWN